MSIYDSTIDLGFGPDIQKKLLLAAAAILLILIIAGIGLWASDLMKPAPLRIEFTRGTVRPGELTNAVVTVMNVSKQDAAKVPVSLVAKENTEFDVYPFNSTFTGQIELISAGDSREVTFVVSPAQKALPGTYTFVARTTINGTDYSREAILTVKQ